MFINTLYMKIEVLKLLSVKFHVKDKEGLSRRDLGRILIERGETFFGKY